MYSAIGKGVHPGRVSRGRPGTVPEPHLLRGNDRHVAFRAGNRAADRDLPAGRIDHGIEKGAMPNEKTAAGPVGPPGLAPKIKLLLDDLDLRAVLEVPDPGDHAAEDHGLALVHIGIVLQKRKGERGIRSEEHTSELQSPKDLVCR